MGNFIHFWAKIAPNASLSLAALIVFFLALVLVSGCKKDDDDTDPNGRLFSYDQGAGSSAGAYLADAVYDKLHIEIQFVTGYKPEPASVENLKAFLNAYCHKPGGIVVTYSEIGTLNKTEMTHADIRLIEDGNRTVYNSGSTLSLYLLFVDASYKDEDNTSNVVGIAYRNTSAAFFGKTIKEVSGGLTQPSAETAETAVMNHELGHLLGLVNNGAAMQSSHQDSGRGKHCNVEDCLMYWAVETGDYISNLTGGTIPELDAYCKADIRAKGGK